MQKTYNAQPQKQYLNLNLNQHANLRMFTCAYCPQLLYTTQHRSTVLIIFPPNLQTSIRTHMLSTGVEGAPCV